ncbi:RyR domain-containing protein [Azotosporobacter soli]|uniref:RyR domain-containing protein n=1 Tax=Azotosporobacter soli TaxID=3055040 RepID=UPI0031FEE42C
MVSNAFKIVVSGDICINSLYWRTNERNSKGLNWQAHVNIHSVFLPGEALLLARLVAAATNGKVIGPQEPELDAASAKEFLQAVGEIERFSNAAGQEKRGQTYRLKQLLGFAGPANGAIKLLPILNDTADADMVIIDDENNGFNAKEEFWPLAIKTTDREPLILYKMSNPNNANALWRRIEGKHINNTIVIINSEDLRSKGVNISKGLSWERTAQDFVWQINNSPNLTFLANCRHLIVLFGMEGAIYYKNEAGSVESHLYFLPYEFEGGSFADDQGMMSGYTSCFVAGIARCITAGSNVEELSLSIGEGIREGIVAAQKYFVAGFGDGMEPASFPKSEIFSEAADDFICKEHVQDVAIRQADNTDHYWYILKEKSSTNLAEIAYNIVKKGVQQSLRYIPIAQFGKLQTVDRTEIESYRSIKNLLCEYISTANTTRPLSIAVFGTPGSGKSFGVTQVAGSIAPMLIERLNFNLSQFRSPLELINAFHKVRDLSLEGKIPLVFFDEFDSAFEGTLGWLKYFLAPMQDGVFREGDSLHSIGKAIFVFAGGTSNTIKNFCGEEISEAEEKKSFAAEFKSAKGPDFLSRLRGYVNILGPNQTEPRYDQLFIIRRAMLLRSLLEKKVPHLIFNGEAQIDTGVLRALLKIPRYKHESRSMEAILDMSLLVGAKKWEQSFLPSKEQLKLHVDEEAFLRHLMHDTFYSEKIESLSMAIHELYRSLNERNPYVSSALTKVWDELDEEPKLFAREQAKHIPDALLRINYDVVSVKEKPPAIEFTESEMDILAAYEHSYWLRYKKANGWKKGEAMDWEKKTDPDLVRWESLSPDKKYNVYKMVKSWPEMLANANFKIEYLKFSGEGEE